MRILAVTFLSLSLFLQACGDSSDAEGPELLFVQSATSAEIENSRLILGGLMFSGRIKKLARLVW